MIRLEHVDKYFNRRKQNEIHVINDTSLTMEKTGLVALLGPSGCGKTTLLNAVGGLDKVQGGRIFINGRRLTGRTAGRVDKLRNLNIGYIFQNYNLVDNMTVFDNVAIALKMVGVRDKKEIEEKVNYVLDQVGLYRYRNRYADMLSGGERQRVGIARAIVKDPAIIIADEPTGNLDSRNTLEVMNIIKAISAHKLVIMVTHEEDLAKFYGSRIIRIKDGSVVSDELNDHSDGLDYRVENKIYLRDIKEHKRLKAGNYNIDFYNDSNSPVDLDVVVKNGNIYIRTRNEDRIEVVDENSNIELLDESYRQITREDATDSSFELQRLAPVGVRKYKSIMAPFELVRKGFQRVMDYNILKKLLLVGFLVAAMFITYSICNIFGVMNITDDEFVGADKSYISIIDKNVSVDQYLAYEADEAYRYILPGDSMVTLTMPFDDYFQTRWATVSIDGSLSDWGKLTAADMVSGRIPENDYEIAVDKMILKNVIEQQMTKTAGYATPEQFIGSRIEIENMPDLVIVGVTDMESPCIYASPNMFINILAYSGATGDEGTGAGLWSREETEASGSTASVMDYNLKADEVVPEKGKWPVNDYEVMVNEKNKESMKLGKEISQQVNGVKLKVVGYYSDKNDSDFLLVNSNTVKYEVITSGSNITMCPVDKTASLEKLRSENVNVRDTYKESRDQYRKQMWDSILSTLIMAGVILIISFIEIYLIIRASFLSRVKEVGVYRAIGVKKSDIYRMFAGEILAITTMSGLPGFALISYILYKLSAMVQFENMFLVNPAIMAICLLLIYGLNMVFGLLPVYRTIRKTPAAILSRNDVN